VVEEPVAYNPIIEINKVYKEVIMAKLTEEAKKAIGAIRPSLVATASKTGKPNVSAKGSLRVLDDEHLLFADIASICLDAAARKGCRIWGKGEIFKSGEIFDKIVAEYASKNMKVRNVVKITVEEVETF